MDVVGRGLAEGFLSAEDADSIARDGLARVEIDGKRVLVIIPDGTRTMPMPVMFDAIERALGPRAAALDYLVALGTHSPMGDDAVVADTSAGRSGMAASGLDISSITAGTILRRS